MEFRIADTFTDSLGRLTADEQKAVKTTAFDLQVNPAHPSLQFHKLDRPKDPNFASVRVSKDIRIIVHRTSGSLLLCYVDHHDEAYRWAERRRIETHPKTGAAQLVEVRETVKEIAVPKYVEVERPSAAKAKPPLFAHLDDDRLLGYGVPPEWLADVKAATEDSLLELADHLPAEAAEALLELATGGTPAEFKAPPAGLDPFSHPDAQRRFRTMHDGQELQRALDYPWEKWTVFLHPAQEQLVRTAFNGPARVSGSAGTGKTIVALHRAAWLARGNPNARVLLATFSDPLANALQTKLRRLLGDEPRLGERIDVHSLDAIGLRLYKAHIGEPKLAARDDIRAALKAASDTVLGHKFSAHFLLTEWEQVVDAWQLDGWEAYRDVARLGRKTRLPEAQRKVLWEIFDKARAALDEGANGPVRTPEQAAREAARRTSELQSRLDELRDSADAKAARQLQDALAKLDLPKDDPAVRDLAEALKQGNFEAAKEAMKAVQEKAASSSGLSESDREKMAKALEDTARQLEQLAKDPAAMADALRQAGMDPELAKNADALREAIEKSGQLNESQKQALQQMAKAAESARERMEKMGEQMRQSASQCRNPGQSGESGAPSEQSESSSGAEGGQDAMSQMLSQAETERQMAQAAEAAQGQCQGGGMSEAEADRALQASSGSDSESDASGGRGRKEGSGGGHGVAEGGDREVRKTAFGTKFQKQKGPRQEGDVIARQLVAGQSPTGESRVALEQVAGAIASGYERGSHDDPEPADLRQVHKRYFGDLRRTFEQRGVAPAAAPAGTGSTASGGAAAPATAPAPRAPTP
jgi:hypothetical protein